MQDQASTRLSPPNRLRRQRGYSVVELSIALSIIAILTVAGLAGVQTVLNTNKSNNQIEQSGQSITKLSSTFQGQTSTANATNAVGVGLGIWPTGRVTGAGLTTAITNLFGGNEFIASNAAGIGTAPNTVAANGGIIYYLTGVPKSACSDLANALSPLVSLVAAGTATTAVTAAPTAIPAGLVTVKNIGDGSINAVNLGTACNTAAASLDLAFLIKP